MGKHFVLYDQEHINPGSERNYPNRQVKSQFRRVWVKRLTGTPTTIMISSDQLVDDLKQAVISKYPNSLGRHFDPAEIQLLVRGSLERSSYMNRRHRKKTLTKNFTLSGEDISTKAANGDSAWQDLDSYFILAPDQNVWDVINEYCGGSMSIDDAFVVDVDANEPIHPVGRGIDDVFPTLFERDAAQKLCDKLPLILRSSDTRSPNIPESTYHQPRPTYPHGHIASINGSNMSYMSRNHQSKPLSASPNFGSRMGMNNPTSSVNSKQPQSVPLGSPGPYNAPAKIANSQPVLLLPKNFSLGDQHPIKTLDTEDSSSDSNKTPKKKKNNTPVDAMSNIDSPEGSTSANTNPNQTQTQAQNQVQTHNSNSSRGSSRHDDINESASHISLPEPHKSLPLTKSSSTKSHSLGSVLRPLEVKTSKLKERNNMSTFDKVLPLISVLVVEDNSINQAILGAFLRKHKIHYHIAKNGQEAVDKWRKGGFHLVLMDIQLPVKSGIEATKEIRNLEKINRIGVFAQHELGGTFGQGQEEITDDQKLDISLFRSPVIIVALTASSNSSVDKKNALTAGCNDFLTKPVNLVWLQNKITEWGCMQALIDFDGWKDKRTLAFTSSGKDVKV